jgi:hypothetical protein
LRKGNPDAESLDIRMHELFLNGYAADPNSGYDPTEDEMPGNVNHRIHFDLTFDAIGIWHFRKIQI